MFKKIANILLSWVMSVERLLSGLRLLADPGAVKNVVVLEYMLPLGCLVHMTPLFEAIKAARPDVVITVATRSLGLALLRHNHQVDHVVETPDPLTDTLGAVKALRAELKRLGVKADCVLTGASDRRSRIALLGLL